jgi:hypothetical protein
MEYEDGRTVTLVRDLSVMSAAVGSVEGATSNVRVTISFVHPGEIHLILADLSNPGETEFTERLRGALERLLTDRFGVEKPVFRRRIDVLG